VIFSNGTLFSKHLVQSKNTQTSTEMGIGCQRNGHWHSPWPWTAINHLSVVCGRAVCRKGLCINSPTS